MRLIKLMKNRKETVFIIVILVLLNGYFAFNNYQNKKKNIYLEAKKHELDSLYTGVSAELVSVERSLDSLKGKNVSLDSILSARETELQSMKEQIEVLLKKNKLTALDLNSLKKLVKQLQEENDKYVETINTLNKKINLLTAANDSLRTSLKTEVASNEKLTAEQKILRKKAEQGSLLKPENVKSSGIKISSKNTETETNSSKKTDKLKLCFDVPENKVADAGQKEILIRIISPSGSTISIENQGSGTFTNIETGELTQYTLSAKFEYSQSKTNVCAYWSQNTAFSKGTYKVIFYQNNYQLTESSFVLK
jgi:regulator of replication initiation timing